MAIQPCRVALIIKAMDSAATSLVTLPASWPRFSADISALFFRW